MTRIVLFMICLLARAAALDVSDTLFVVNTAGDTLRGTPTILERPFQADLVLINGDSLTIKEVSAIRNKDGFFRPAGKGYPSDALAERISDGETIDVFVYRTMSFDHPHLGGNTGMMLVGMKLPDDLLYSKMDRKLKEIDYGNVRADFWDNPASREQLQRYQRKRSLMYVGFIGGFASLLAAGPIGSENMKIGVPFALAGVVGIATGIYQSSTKNRCLAEAVLRYEK